MEQWPGSLRHRVVLRLADGRIESVGESRFFYLCWKQGLPLPIPQYEVYDDNGRLVAVVDFAWPELGLFVEFDGKIKYRAPDRDGETVVDVVLREKRREELVFESPAGGVYESCGRTSTSRRIPLHSCRACSGRRPWPTERTARAPTLLQGVWRFCTETSL